MVLLEWQEVIVDRFRLHFSEVSSTPTVAASSTRSAAVPTLVV